MSESKNDMVSSFAEHPIGSDLAKVDAHVIRPEEYDELPELTDEMMARADVYIGDRLVRRGGATRSDPEDEAVIRLSPMVLDYFRATGPGWQQRIDTILLDALERETVGD